MKGKAEEELEQLQRQDISDPVEFSKWVASIVPFLKVDNTGSICGDYKLTLNKVVRQDE